METCGAQGTCKKSAGLFHTFPQIEAHKPLIKSFALMNPMSPDAVFAKPSSALRHLWALKWSCISPEIGFKFQADVAIWTILHTWLSWLWNFHHIMIQFPQLTSNAWRNCRKTSPSSLIDLVSSPISNNFRHKINSAILQDAVTGLPDAHPSLIHWYSLIVYVETIHSTLSQAFQVLSPTGLQEKQNKVVAARINPNLSQSTWPNA